MRMRIVNYLILIAVFVNQVSGLKDSFLDETQKSCFKSHNAYSCLKYKALKFFAGITDGSAWPKESSGRAEGGNDTISDYSALKLVYIDNVDAEEVDEDQGDDTGFFEDARQLESDSEWDKMLKFVKRHAKYYLMSHGISLNLPQGTRAVPEGGEDVKDVEEARSGAENPRGKRKRLAILLPFLSLISLLKVKLLLVPILLSVLFIKKLLIVAALFLPTILSTLKICKVPHAAHHHSQWGGVEAAPEYTSGYGAAYSSYGGVGNPAYSKDWAASRAYNGYKTIYDKPAGLKPMLIQPTSNVNAVYAENQGQLQ